MRKVLCFGVIIVFALFLSCGITFAQKINAEEVQKNEGSKLFFGSSPRENGYALTLKEWGAMTEVAKAAFVKEFLESEKIPEEHYLACFSLLNNYAQSCKINCFDFTLVDILNQYISFVRQ